MVDHSDWVVLSVLPQVGEEAVTCTEEGVHALAATSAPGGINHMVRELIHGQGSFHMRAPAIDRLAKNIPHEH
ncbi:MAG: hypothetical protein IKK44_01650 [Clostridium sp.]|nr:hypothetical protein [Clostridium sp.]